MRDKRDEGSAELDIGKSVSNATAAAELSEDYTERDAIHQTEEGIDEAISLVGNCPITQMAAENSKSTRLLEGLRAELLQKLNEIGNCNAKTALHQQQLQIIEFKRSHYVNFDSTSSVNNQCSELLNMLRMIEHKLKMQLNYELQ